SNNFGTISQCYATGSVGGGIFSGGLGGLCGWNYQESTISQSYATGSVTGGFSSWNIGGLCGFNQLGTISHCYATGAVLGGTNSQNLGGFCGDNSRGEIRECFFDVETSGGPVNGLGQWMPTALMQTVSTFIDAGWDFVTPIWFIREGEYPRLLWEIEMVEGALKLTPQTLNCRSQGNWVKAHLVLPEGYTVEDVDTDTPATLQPLGLTSGHLEVSVNKEKLVEVTASFDREAFCGAVGDLSEGLTVFGYFTDGLVFYGTASVRIITPGLEELAELAAYWLEDGCKKPHWCGGLDLNRDSVVNLSDFTLLQKSHIEFIYK
ncbi:GLUG motif-containing protein, partial [Planctomycetota bacterium]